MFKSHVGLGADFKCIVKNASGEVVNESGWSHNLVLDAGLVRMGVGPWVQMCAVGTGNSVPEKTQTRLDNQIAKVGFGYWDDESRVTDANPHFIMHNTAAFGLGVAAGNLTEVGLGWGTDQLWDRALILDSEGQPTTITVLSDEFLEIKIRIFVYLNINTFTVDLKKLDGTVVSSHTFTPVPVWDSSGLAQTQLYALSIPFGQYNHDTIPGEGTLEGSFKSIYKHVYGMGPNISINRALYTIFGFARVSVTAIHYQITPPIPKTDLQELTFTVELSWGRHEG